MLKCMVIGYLNDVYMGLSYLLTFKIFRLFSIYVNRWFVSQLKSLKIEYKVPFKFSFQ